MNHNTGIRDQDPYFEIATDTRKVVNKSTTKTAIMQFDHNSERFTFSADRFIENHDMTECDSIEIHYLNESLIDKEIVSGMYKVGDVSVDPDDDTKIIFTWLLSQNVTRQAGALTFIIRFVCLDSDKKPSYIWSTRKFKGFSVEDGFDNVEDILDLESDIVHQLINDIKNINNNGSGGGSENDEMYQELRSMIDQLDSTTEQKFSSLVWSKLSIWQKETEYRPSEYIASMLSDGSFAILKVGSNPITSTKEYADQESFYGTTITKVFSTLSTVDIESALDRILAKYGLGGDSE